MRTKQNSVVVGINLAIITLFFIYRMIYEARLADALSNQYIISHVVIDEFIVKPMAITSLSAALATIVFARITMPKAPRLQAVMLAICIVFVIFYVAMLVIHFCLPMAYPIAGNSVRFLNSARYLFAAVGVMLAFGIQKQ